MIWYNETLPSLDALNASGNDTLVSLLDIKVVDVTEDSISASMPVDERTRQPYGILHGGASVVLAETIGSIASAFVVDMRRYRVVGLDINANHIRAVSGGRVKATATPAHLGRRTHVWKIEQVDERGKLSCISRLTMAIIDAEAA
ncbi:MAG: hotdog fold thioesterase [Woeseiaceae bacterium]